MVSNVTNSSQAPQVYPVRQVGAMDKVSQEQMYDPGLYALRELMEPPPEYRKQGGFFSFLGKLILTAGVVGGAAVLGRRYISALKNIELKGLGEKAEFFEKVKYRTAQFGQWVEDKSVGLYKRVKDFIASKKDAPAAAGESKPAA